MSFFPWNRKDKKAKEAKKAAVASGAASNSDISKSAYCHSFVLYVPCPFLMEMLIAVSRREETLRSIYFRFWKDFMTLPAFIGRNRRCAIRVKVSVRGIIFHSHVRYTWGWVPRLRGRARPCECCNVPDKNQVKPFPYFLWELDYTEPHQGHWRSSDTYSRFSFIFYTLSLFLVLPQARGDFGSLSSIFLRRPRTFFFEASDKSQLGFYFCPPTIFLAHTLLLSSEIEPKIYLWREKIGTEKRALLNLFVHVQPLLPRGRK